MNLVLSNLLLAVPRLYFCCDSTCYVLLVPGTVLSLTFLCADNVENSNKVAE